MLSERNSELEIIYSKSKKYKRQYILDILEKYNDLNTLCYLNSDTFTKNINKNDIDVFRKCYLYQTKIFFNGNSKFGLIHVRFSLFVKDSNRYDEYIKTLIIKINNAIKVTNENNKHIKNRFYVFLDLDNVNMRNFSRRLFNKVCKILEEKYDNKPINYFVSGKQKLIKILWPLVSIFLNKEKKNKTIFLDY